MKTTSLKISAGLGLALFAALTASAIVITEDFNTWPGAASDNGWTTAWVSQGSNGSSTTSSLQPAGGWTDATGSYLSSTVNGSATNGPNTQAFVSRIVDGSLFDRSESLNISFLFRPDSSVGTPTTGTGWRFIFNNGAHTVGTGDTNLFTVNASSTWTIGGFSTAPGSGSVTEDSEIALVTGNTYSFSFDINLANSSLTATINDLTAGSSFTSSSLYFRTIADVTNFSIQIGALLATSGSTTGKSMSFSLDTLSISQGVIPEPSTYAALFGVTGLLAALLIRRRLR
ncbi:hypothetical protein OPIT5_14245 [Opitutaceae bacterium TAV5]|nr:hypothetical protein OPIT5_14245 [Opitutaceae bacterium TAV5]